MACLLHISKYRKQGNYKGGELMKLKLDNNTTISTNLIKDIATQAGITACSKRIIVNINKRLNKRGLVQHCVKTHRIYIRSVNDLSALAHELRHVAQWYDNDSYLMQFKYFRELDAQEFSKLYVK